MNKQRKRHLEILWGAIHNEDSWASASRRVDKSRLGAAYYFVTLLKEEYQDKIKHDI